MNNRLFCYIFSYFFCMLFVSKMVAQGLIFDSSFKTIEERPSYIVFKSGKEPNFFKDFTIDFKLSIRKKDKSGHIFLLRDKKGVVSYTFTYAFLDDNHISLNFNTLGEINHCSFDLDNKNYSKWLHIELHFNLEKDSLYVTVGGIKRNIKLDLSNKFTPVLCFGKNDYNIDIPFFAIKDLKVFGNHQEFIFPLNESSGFDVHDIDGNAQGVVISPHWMINDSYHWNYLGQSYSVTPSGIAFDEINQVFHLFTQDSVRDFIISTKRFVNKSSSKNPVHIQLGTNFFNPGDQSLYVYEVNNLPIGDVTISQMDKSYNWHKVGYASLPMQLHHHIGFWNNKTKQYTIFGGFGNEHYSNCFFTYDINSDKWDTIQMKGLISPRYFSSSAFDEESQILYIYGGMGNDIGQTSIGRNYYHDLYKVDIKKQTIEKLWGGISDVHRVPVRNMILSGNKKFLYAIIYPEYISKTYLQLYRISISDGTIQAVGDSILMNSQEIYTNANLYYNEINDEFYCTIQEFDKQLNVNSRIYSLAAPPASIQDLELYSKTDNWKGGNYIIVLLLILPAIYIVKFKKVGRFTKIADKERVTIDNGRTFDGSLDKNEEEGVQSFIDLTHVDYQTKNAVYLFGVFSVFNRNGDNISHLFSPRVKQVFLYLLFHSSKGGVLSSALNEVFWKDKSDQKIKNLKGVTINQIRKILSELDGIELVYEKGYFKILLNQSVCYCDYISFINVSESSVKVDDGMLYNILIRGKFLLGDNVSIFDSHKLYVEDYLNTYLPLNIKLQFTKHNYERVIRLCHILLNVDSLNEFALGYLVYTLNYVGNSQEAILSYTLFANEYKQVMGEDTSLQYENLSSFLPVLTEN